MGEHEQKLLPFSIRLMLQPNQQRTPFLSTELRCRIFVDNHRNEHIVHCNKLVPNVQNPVCMCVFQPSLHFAYHHWWLGIKTLGSGERKAGMQFLEKEIKHLQEEKKVC